MIFFPLTHNDSQIRNYHKDRPIGSTLELLPWDGEHFHSTALKTCPSACFGNFRERQSISFFSMSCSTPTGGEVVQVKEPDHCHFKRFLNFMKARRLQSYVDICIPCANMSRASCKCSALLIDERGRILSFGYNGETSELANQSDKETVVHSEQNTIVWCAHDLKKEKNLIYMCNRMPCGKCASLILNYDVAGIVFLQPLFYTKTVDMCYDKQVPLFFLKDDEYLRGLYVHDFKLAKEFAMNSSPESVPERRTYEFFEKFAKSLPDCYELVVRYILDGKLKKGHWPDLQAPLRKFFARHTHDDTLPDDIAKQFATFKSEKQEDEWVKFMNKHFENLVDEHLQTEKSPSNSTLANDAGEVSDVACTNGDVTPPQKGNSGAGDVRRPKPVPQISLPDIPFFQNVGLHDRFEALENIFRDPDIVALLDQYSKEMIDEMIRN